MTEDVTKAAPVFDLAIVGAGPIGLETAILAKRAGLSYVLLEKGAIVNAVANYPTYMTFFTTSERLEVGGHPLVTATDKPTRREALDYYRKVTQAEDLNVRLYTRVVAIERAADGFVLRARPASVHEGAARPDERGSTPEDAAATEAIRARRVAVATGYFDFPNHLGIPGEDLPNVRHYFTEPHPFWRRNVTIVGAGSSAADAALELFRGGARVTMVHRGDDFRHSLKYWIRPNLENRVKEGSISAYFRTVVREITPREVVAERDGEPVRIPTDFTFLLTGYYADPQLLERAGVRVDPRDLSAALDPETFESNVPGLYVVGSAGFGSRTSDVFIENGLVHARKAIAAIERSLRQVPAGA